MWPFRHRHRWTIHRRINREHGIIFTIRECTCGSREIQSRVGRWQPYNDALAKMPEWEIGWLGNSEPYVDP